MGACEWCIAWGNKVNAACSHTSDKCLFKPNGAIQKKLGCTYKVLCSGTKNSEINKAHAEIFKEMKANKGKTATSSVVQRTPNGKGVTFNDPVATVSVNQRVPNKDNPVSVSSANAPEPSPTNEDSPVEFDTGEEHATAASATQKAPTANMLNDDDIDSQLAMENEHDSNDAPFFTIQFATFVTYKRNVKVTNNKIRLAGMRQHLYGNKPAQKKCQPTCT